MKGYEKSYEVIDDIEIYRHPLREGKGALGYLVEYSQAIFWEFILSWNIFLKNRFHVIHGCNPPDLIFITALFFKPFRSEEHTSELQSRENLVCRLLLE